MPPLSLIFESVPPLSSLYAVLLALVGVIPCFCFLPSRPVLLFCHLSGGERLVCFARKRKRRKNQGEEDRGGESRWSPRKRKKDRGAGSSLPDFAAHTSGRIPPFLYSYPRPLSFRLSRRFIFKSHCKGSPLLLALPPSAVHGRGRVSPPTPPGFSLAPFTFCA